MSFQYVPTQLRSPTIPNWNPQKGFWRGIGADDGLVAFNTNNTNLGYYVITRNLWTYRLKIDNAVYSPVFNDVNGFIYWKDNSNFFYYSKAYGWILHNRSIRLRQRLCFSPATRNKPQRRRSEQDRLFRFSPLAERYPSSIRRIRTERRSFREEIFRPSPLAGQQLQLLRPISGKEERTLFLRRNSLREREMASGRVKQSIRLVGGRRTEQRKGCDIPILQTGRFRNHRIQPDAFVLRLCSGRRNRRRISRRGGDMEMIQYTSPVSWDDKGMDWESPDPGNLDYYRAIWEAVIERASLVRQSPNEALHSMMKYRPWSVAAMNAIRESIYTLAPYFVNMEFDDYKEDLSDFPKMWSFRELVNAEGCRICEHPGVGSRISEWGKWLKAIRNTLNKLTVINFTDVSGEDFSRYGAVHDPPFEESISTVLDQTLRGDPNKGKFNSFPQTFCSWSGNTDYKMDPDGTKGYCGYAQSKSILIKTVQRPHPTAECDLIFRYKITPPTGPLSFSTVLQESVPDLADCGLSFGIHNIRMESTTSGRTGPRIWN